MLTQEDILKFIKNSSMYNHILDVPDFLNTELNQLNLDSIDTLELLMELEDHFNISIDEEGISHLMTFSNFIDAVVKKVNS